MSATTAARPAKASNISVKAGKPTVHISQSLRGQTAYKYSSHLRKAGDRKAHLLFLEAAGGFIHLLSLVCSFSGITMNVTSTILSILYNN